MNTRDSLDRSSSENVSGVPFANGSTLGGGIDPQATPVGFQEPLSNNATTTIDEILSSDVCFSRMRIDT